jgi:glutamate racemase
MAQYPIGVFDSGYGGLTILRDLKKSLPEYDYLYLGDNARAPYGPRSYDTVYQFTLEAVKWFFERDCKLVVLACNTASAKALRTIQQNDLPKMDPSRRVLGVIRPTAEIIGQYSTAGHIGIMGTVGTIQSESYLIETTKFFPDLIVSQQPCPEWVGLVEKNLHDTSAADEPVKNYIEALLNRDSKIDTILLACTHYPLLIPKIIQYFPDYIRIVEQGPIVAKSLRDYLMRHPEIAAQCSKTGKADFYTTGDTIDFDRHAGVFFGEKMASKHTFLG